jgi:ATP-dependent protease HslVU (ClpYQ) peptidase subunit
MKTLKSNFTEIEEQVTFENTDFESEYKRVAKIAHDRVSQFANENCDNSEMSDDEFDQKVDDIRNNVFTLTLTNRKSPNLYSNIITGEAILVINE